MARRALTAFPRSAWERENAQNFFNKWNLLLILIVIVW